MYLERHSGPINLVTSGVPLDFLPAQSHHRKVMRPRESAALCAADGYQPRCMWLILVVPEEIVARLEIDNRCRRVRAGLLLLPPFPMCVAKEAEVNKRPEGIAVRCSGAEALPCHRFYHATLFA